jgi:hypothetical protein
MAVYHWLFIKLLVKRFFVLVFVINIVVSFAIGMFVNKNLFSLLFFFSALYNLRVYSIDNQESSGSFLIFSFPACERGLIKTFYFLLFTCISFITLTSYQ